MTLAPCLRRAAGTVIGVVLFAVAVVFTSALLAFGAVAALLVWAWLAWRRHRPLRGVHQGRVVEGEYRVEPELPRQHDGNPLP